VTRLSRRDVLAAALAGAAFATAPRALARREPAGPSVPAALPALARGVNLSHWFWLSRGDGYITEHDVRLLADAKVGGEERVFTHARLPIDPAFIWDGKGGAIAENLATLRRAVEVLLGAGLGVVIDPHPRDGVPWTDPNAGVFEREYGSMWKALAAELAGTDTARVAMEIMNEPHNLDRADRWASLQKKLAAIIREHAPGHTIIATGDNWGGIDGLQRVEPLTDPNVVYSFHWYDPAIFTHQGATWGWKPWEHACGLDYPSAGAADAAGRITDPQARAAAEAYVRDKWDGVKVRGRFGEAHAWATRHNARVYCGEFGVHAKCTPVGGRGLWIRHAADALRALGVGCAAWDYAGSFALASGEPGKRTLDEGLLAALAGAPAP